jgi:hypothetical protein
LNLNTRDTDSMKPALLDEAEMAEVAAEEAHH